MSGSCVLIKGFRILLEECYYTFFPIMSRFIIFKNDKPTYLLTIGIFLNFQLSYKVFSIKGANHFDGRSPSIHNQRFCIEGIALLIHARTRYILM